MIYRMAVVDRYGAQHVLEAVGVDTITDSQPIPDPEAVRAAFPGVPEEVLSMPVGKVGLLLGMTERHLHAEGGKSVGKLRLSETPLGCGKVVTGMAAVQGESCISDPISAECLLPAVRPGSPAFTGHKLPPLSPADSARRVR